jgi:hypothetical protein
MSFSVASPDPLYAYTASDSIPILEGTTQIELWALGAGGSGEERVTTGGPGGGGGGFAYLLSDVLTAEWSTNLTGTVGVGGSNANGGPTTITGTLNGSAISMSGGGGERGATTTPGVGGSASGGTSNTAGQDGGPAIFEDGVWTAGAGGAPGAFLADDAVLRDLNYGYGGTGTFPPSGDLAGSDGVIYVRYYF